jgi:hypothetical protein
MKLHTMSFKNYVWLFNPQNIRIEYTRNVKEIPLPGSGSTLQDFGFGKRVVTGKGELIGKNCMEEFGRLAAIFAEEGAGTLQLPGTAPFEAVFSELKMIGEAQPDCVRYEFVFLEENLASSGESSVLKDGIYICKGGESLWSVANRYGTTVDQLRALNPMIQWPNGLEAGQKVVLP